MILNESSEDLLTSDVFGLLKYLDPAIWLIPLLECTFQGRCIDELTGMKAKVEFWRKFRAPPNSPHHESTSEVDIVIRIGDFVILIECKFLSGLQAEGSSGKSRDQIIRYLDAATFNLINNTDEALKLLFILLTDTWSEPPTLSRYRDPGKVAAGLTHARPFVDYESVAIALAGNIGWASWSDLLHILERKDQHELQPIEAAIVEDLIQYLSYKLTKVKRQYEGA